MRSPSRHPIDPRPGQRLRALRLQRGMSQGALAGEDFSKGFISLVECGRSRMSLRAVEVLAARLGVRPQTLIEGASGPASVPDALDMALAALDEMERYAREKRAIIRRVLAQFEDGSRLQLAARAALERISRERSGGTPRRASRVG